MDDVGGPPVRIVRDGDTDPLVAKILLHDANNVLSLILATASLLEPGERVSHEDRALLLDAGQRLSAILARLAAHQRQAPEPRLVSVNIVVGALLPMLRLVAADRVVKTHLESDLPDVRID